MGWKTRKKDDPVLLGDAQRDLVTDDEAALPSDAGVEKKPTDCGKALGRPVPPNVGTAPRPARAASCSSSSATLVVLSPAFLRARDLRQLHRTRL